jgi:hypothetical protein
MTAERDADTAGSPPPVGRRWVAACLAALIAMGGVWALAVPRFAQPDEAAHVVKAAGVVRGQIVGAAPDTDDLARLDEDQRRRAAAGFSPLPSASSLTVVEVPASLASGGEQRSCYARRELVTPADCPGLSGSTEIVPAWTWQGTNPPWVHAVLGVATLVDPSARSVWWMRGIGVLLCAGLLTASATALRRVGGLAPAGFLVALTPTVVFLSGGATPNGIEVAAGVTVFAGLVALWRVPGWAPARHIAGVGAVTLALARPIGPMLLVVAVVAVVAWGGSPGRLLRLGRGWLVGVVAAVGVAAVWIVAAGSLASGRNTNPGTDAGLLEVVGGTTSRLGLYLRQSVGVFDADRAAFVPLVVVLGWALALVVVLVVVRRGRREDVAIAGLAVVAAVLLPVAMEALSAADAANWWRGRYQLPLLVGVAILAAVGRLRWAPVGRTLVVVVVGATFAIGHVVALWTLLRRYGAGADAPVWYFDEVRWETPLPAALLLVVYTVAVMALVGLSARSTGASGAPGAVAAAQPAGGSRSSDAEFMQ